MDGFFISVIVVIFVHLLAVSFPPSEPNDRGRLLAQQPPEFDLRRTIQPELGSSEVASQILVSD